LVRYGKTAASPPSDPRWQPVQDSYRSAETAPDRGDVQPTENIDAGLFSQHTNPNRLFMPVQPGGFDHYTIISATARPDPPVRAMAQIGLLPLDWQGGTTYSFDPVYLDMQPGHATNGKYVLLDMTLIANGQSDLYAEQAGLLAFKWNVLAGAWVHIATTNALLFPHDCAPVVLATTVTLATVPGSQPKYFAFVGTDDGVFSVNLNNLKSSQTMSIVNMVNPGGSDCARMHAVARSGNHLFCWVQIGSGQVDAHVYVYSWNESTGAIDSTPVHVIDVSPPYDSLSIRARFDPMGAGDAGSVYFAAAKYLLQFSYPGAGGNLTFTGRWNGDYTGALQDCRTYTLPGAGGAKGVLTVKDRESFAFVRTQ
jgi:hypothetical protein